MITSTSTSVGSVLFFCLVSYGLTFMIKDALIFEKFREVLRKVTFFETLLHCSFCVGTWSGLLMAGVYTYENNLETSGGLLVLFLSWSLAAATASYVLELLTQLLESKLEG